MVAERSRQNPRDLVMRLAVALLVVHAAVVGGFWAWQLSMPHAVEQAEARILGTVLWWKAGVFPYGDLSELPLIANPYGPLYLGALKLLPTLPGYPYLLGRSISLVSVAAVLLLVGVWVKRRTGDSRLALVCALLPLTGKPLLMFSAIARVDGMALALSLAGFCLATTTRSRRGLVLAAAIFLLAFATKTSQIAAPAALVLYYWINNRKRAWALGAMVGLGFPVLVLVMERMSGGAYLANAALGNLSGGWSHVADAATRPAIVLFWLLALTWVAVSNRISILRSPAFFYTLSCWATNALFGFNPMTSWNFLMEFFFALALLTGEVLGGDAGGHAPSRAWWPRAVLVGHVTVSTVLFSTLIHREVRQIAEYRPRYEAAWRLLSPMIESGDRLAVVDSAAGRDVLNALEAPNPIILPRLIERSSVAIAVLEKALRDDELEGVFVGEELARVEAGGLARALAGARGGNPL